MDDFIKLLLIVGILVVTFVVVLLNEPDDTSYTRVVTSNGFHNVKLLESGTFAAFSCGDRDYYVKQFEATNANQDQVHGIVCCGLVKACTVRFQLAK